MIFLARKIGVTENHFLPYIWFANDRLFVLSPFTNKWMIC